MGNHILERAFDPTEFVTFFQKELDTHRARASEIHYWGIVAHGIKIELSPVSQIKHNYVHLGVQTTEGGVYVVNAYELQPDRNREGERFATLQRVMDGIKLEDIAALSFHIDERMKTPSYFLDDELVANKMIIGLRPESLRSSLKYTDARGMTTYDREDPLFDRIAAETEKLSATDRILQGTNNFVDMRRSPVLRGVARSLGHSYGRRDPADPVYAQG